MSYPLKQVSNRKAIKRYKIWYKQSKFDLQISSISFNKKFFEWACYQSSQSVEKGLKSILMYEGWWPPRSHKLSVLIGLCNKVNKVFRETKFSFRNVEVYTYISRYPFVLPNQKISPHEFIQRKDSRNCIKEAKNIFNIVGDVVSIPSKTKEIEKEKIEISRRLEYVKNRLQKELEPEVILLFGGYAKGKKRLSTLDILIILKTEQDFLQRIHKVREITKGGLPAVEPVIYTPKEFQLLVEEGDVFLFKILEEGKVLYRKSKEKIDKRLIPFIY